MSRKILHFTEQGLFRECYVVNEHSHYGEMPIDVLDIQLKYIRTRHKPQDPVPGWRTLVETYSKTEFSNPEDRLIALSSFAKAIHLNLGDNQYCAGIWKSEIIRGMLWYTLFPRAKSTAAFSPIAPSWSWASTTGPIKYVSELVKTDSTWPLVELVSISILPTQANNPYGNIKRGELTLRGQLIEQQLPAKNLESGSDFAFDDCYDAELYWDVLPDADDDEKVYKILLVIAFPKVISWESAWIYYGGIVLEPVHRGSKVSNDEQTTPVYRKIGLFKYMVVEDVDDWAEGVPSDLFEDTTTIVLI